MASIYEVGSPPALVVSSTIQFSGTMEFVRCGHHVVLVLRRCSFLIFFLLLPPSCRCVAKEFIFREIILMTFPIVPELTVKQNKTVNN